MPAVVVVGLQWGDEGKGKIVDFISEKADLAVRYQGGANAGHTVVLNGRTYRFHHLPVAALRGKHVCLASGMVIDPVKLIEELESLSREGIRPRLTIDGRAHIVLDIHKLLDEAEESSGKGVGTTKRGIGPAYTYKCARVGVRFSDLADTESIKPRLKKAIDMARALLSGVYNMDAELDVERVTQFLHEVTSRLGGYIGDVSLLVNETLDRGGFVILEGAQGTLLDIDHGTYPFVTSSNTTAGAACNSVGIGPKRVDEVIGVAKAYATRVGKGPFPTEMEEPVASTVRERGREYGTTTGRPRRVGWFDAVAVRYSIMLNGVTSVALTKADCLAGIDPVKVCLAYELDGQEIKSFPSSPYVLERCKPVYAELDGWEALSREEKLAALKGNFDALPKQLREYVDFLESLLACPIKYLSIGAERQETVIR
ncbi:MAG: adenylosuccinate synthase [Candidatus Terraquivivens tikiterensis]|uniref:Adenylosuccinate synthetase n=1 Tax=Candidatus Terraquivivens tikiterensis TaxID=1980982 RepID=A0A2R7Y2U6_9ARCH|nr:MAG: adenylosuccinate synthase [Candidatus Terraquivivens tikiterensis]